MSAGRYLHYVIMAWRPGASAHIADYGILDVASDSMSVERAILLALREFRDDVAGGAKGCGEQSPFDDLARRSVCQR